MADQNSAASPPVSSNLSASLAEFTVPAPLKFLTFNIKNLVPTQLTNENYAIWHLQLYQHFSANGFSGHLTGATICPPETDYNLWKLIDRNLISTLLSTISPSCGSTTIRTSLNPISLDVLYSLLYSEEINLQHEQLKDMQQQSDTVALLSTRNNSARGRFNKSRGRGSNSHPPLNLNSQSQGAPSPANRPTCQICGKSGHTTLNCWHRCNPQYAPSSRNPRALLAHQQIPSTVEWVLDSKATSHLTSDASNLQQHVPYNCMDSVSIENGSTIPIQNTGQGILPLPDSARKLYLRNLLHISSLS
ncbi:hypothetical protein M5K25_015462 [Dendrobium thyrsiflorum]|uniref:Retrovirus-related Pol polyprotein from transposon TNT 1-94 n=1 Tax=Dendrobium thyrsiflorum TaxID=117978 RepID=A0ABD0UQU3_DENTH